MTPLWSWFVANSMAAMCQCLVGKDWVVLPLATQERLFFVPATTVRIVTTLMKWVSSMKRVSNKGKKGLKRGKEVGRGRHNFLAKWSTAREEDVELTGVSNTVAFTHTVESRREGNAHGFSTFWVSGVVVFFGKILSLLQALPAHVLDMLFTENGLARNRKSQSRIRSTSMATWKLIQVAPQKYSI